MKLLQCFYMLIFVDCVSGYYQQLHSISTIADIGDSAYLYCSYREDNYNSYYTSGPKNFQWFVSNGTDMYNSTSYNVVDRNSPRFQINTTSSSGVIGVDFQPPHHYNLPTYCPILNFDHQGTERFVLDHDVTCITKVLVVLNVTEEDYLQTFRCSQYGRILKILRPNTTEENPEIISSDRYYDRNVFQCVSHQKISWFISLNNKTLINIMQPEKLPIDWISKDFHREIFLHNESLYESFLFLATKRSLLQNYSIYCGGNVTTSRFVKGFSNQGEKWENSHDVWEYEIEYSYYKIGLALIPLIIIASVIAFVRGGLLNMCKNRLHGACLSLLAQALQRVQPQRVVYMPLVSVQSEEEVLTSLSSSDEMMVNAEEGAPEEINRA